MEVLKPVVLGNDLGSLRNSAKGDSAWANLTSNAGADTYDYCIVCKPHKTTMKAAENLKEELQAQAPDVKILVPDTEGKHAEDGIRNARNVILFLSADFTSDEKVISQMSLAQSLKKHAIRVVETLVPYHAPNKFEDLLDVCPDHLKGMLGDKDSCIEMSHGAGKKGVVAQIIKSALKVQKSAVTGIKRNVSLGGLVYQSGAIEIQVFDTSLVTFAALCGVSLPGAGPWTKKWSVTVWIILSICAMMCLSRFSTTIGPAFLDYATIIQISVDHPALVLFLFVSFKLVRSKAVEDLVENHISCTKMVEFQKCKQKIATGLSALLTVSLVLFGWTGYLPGFFHGYYIQNSNGGLVLFGLAHGIIWVVILPIFFGSLFAALLIMFVVQELCYCAVFSTFSKLHPTLHDLHEVAAGGKELKVTRDDLARFQQSYLTEWERTGQIQKVGAVPFMVFWLLEFCLMVWSIWSLAQGFDADDEDDRVPRLESHWNLVVRLTFFMVHSLWFGAGALIVGFLPFGTNFYGLRIRQLCRRLQIPDANIKAELMTFLQAHDLNFRVWFMRTSLWALPLYAVIVGINIGGFDAEVARIFGAYDP